ncbi:MAG TPA: S41 family peptidase, partial [Pedobacter sp.]
MKSSSLSFKTLLVIFLLFSVSGCRKSDPGPDYPAGTQENINSWVLDSMKVYYYWNTSLPDRPNLSQDPSAFFKGIKNGADRFSSLVNPDLPGTYPPSLVHTLGFDLVTLQTSSGTVETMISLVMPGSRAADTGLLRGDKVETINGVVPTAGNIAGLIEKGISDQVLNLTITGRTGTITISRLISDEAPVYTYKVFQSGGKTFGYLFLNSFEEPAVSQLEEAFTYFKQHQVQELLLDLRYNPGGSVPVAASLAAMIAPGATEGNTFVEYRGNANAGSRKSSFAAETGKLSPSLRKSFSQFAGYRLGLSRIYVFTGGHTASAA